MHCFLQPSELPDYCGRAEWLGRNPYRLRTVFYPYLFSLAPGVRIPHLCKGLDSYRPECLQFREELRCTPKRDSPTLERTAQAVVVPLPQAKALDRTGLQCPNLGHHGRSLPGETRGHSGPRSHSANVAIYSPLLKGG